MAHRNTVIRYCCATFVPMQIDGSFCLKLDFIRLGSLIESHKLPFVSNRRHNVKMSRERFFSDAFEPLQAHSKTVEPLQKHSIHLTNCYL